ncbi:MAG: acyloxyacyl hydrolase [Verrucomicrobiota bacterium]
MDLSVENAQLFDIGNINNTWVSPIMVSIRWQLDDVGNTGWLRGNTEWVFTGYFTPVLEGVENRFSGALFGPRYNFVQPGSKLVPYLDTRVGFGFTDSQNVRGAQGQDFYFTFTVGVGARYLISDQWDIALGVIYQHISNAGLSEPGQPNNGLDTIGPHMALQFQF